MSIAKIITDEINKKNQFEYQLVLRTRLFSDIQFPITSSLIDSIKTLEQKNGFLFSTVAYLLSEKKISDKDICGGLLHLLRQLEQIDITTFLKKEKIKQYDEVSCVVDFLYEYRNPYQLFLNLDNDVEAVISLFKKNNKENLALLIIEIYNFYLLICRYDGYSAQNIPHQQVESIIFSAFLTCSELSKALNLDCTQHKTANLALDLLYPFARSYTRKFLQKHFSNTAHLFDRCFYHIKTVVLKYYQNSKVKYRVKNVYSIWPKICSKGEMFYDIVGIRIIVSTVKECYEVFDFLQEKYFILANKVKDFIAFPKSNGYQSIHAVVRLGTENTQVGNCVEVQIRTQDMNAVCRKGESAHILYKYKKISQSIEYMNNAVQN